MSTFSDKLAVLLKNYNNNINSTNKKNETIQKSKQIDKIKTFDKNKNKDKKDNINEIKLQNNNKIINGFSIDENANEQINNKKQIDNKKINNNQNNIKKQLLLYEKKENTADTKKNDINKSILKETQKNNNTFEKNINSNLGKNKYIQQFHTEDKKDMNNQVENKKYNNNSNLLKERLSIFDSKIKSNEKKENNNSKIIVNIEKDNKEKINIDKKNNDISNIKQKINSIEILDKPDNKLVNKIKEEKKSDINIINNKKNNISDIKKIANGFTDKTPKNKEIKSNNFKSLEEQNNNIKINKNLEVKSENEIIKKKTFINNQTFLETDSLNSKYNKLNSNKINKIILNNEIKDNDENMIKTAQNSISNSQISNISEDNNNNIFLKSEIISKSIDNDTFCIGFFIVSFNFNYPKIIENSNELMADCGHAFCSSSPAISPEIYARYPEKDTDDFEISELGASICFPNGIKLCFEKNELHINGLKNYSTILTNQLGKRYFLTTYHLYFKYSYDEFMNKYEYGKSIDKSLLEDINIKYIYIPFGICLLSKYPFFNQMEKCLESLRFTIDNNKSNPNEIYDLLIYLIKSIPVPSPGIRLNFPLPYYSELISINQPQYKDTIIFGDNPAIILENLSVEELIIIMRLLLFEQKVLLIGNNYDMISQIIYNFSILLYPMQWVHTFIPIMTETTIRYLDSFLPFFNGMHSSLFDLAASTLEATKENIYIYDINKHIFQMNMFPSLNSKNIIKKINELIPQFPKNILNNITFGLRVVKSYLDKTKDIRKSIDENLGVNIKIKGIFIQAFIEIFYDYKTYLTLINEKPIFNTKTMLEKKSKADYKFYNEITQTQLFHLFIQNNPVNEKANTFFEEQLDLYDSLKDKKYFMEEFINNYNSTCEISENYFIPPEILSNFDIQNQKIIKNQGLLTKREYKKYIKKKYFIYDAYFNSNSILKSNKLIINEIFTFENKKLASEINYYILPKIDLEKKKILEIEEKIILNTNSKEELGKELTPAEKDDIKENITDVITKLFKNDEISEPEESEKIILNSLNNDYGIDLYTNSLYNNKNILHKPQFDFLEKLIYSSLNKISSVKITESKKCIYCSQLVKCCENFRTKEKSLADTLYPKMGKIQILNEENVWKEYANIYLKDNCSEEMDKDDKWIECLKRMRDIMTIMGLNKTMIYSTLANLGKDNMTESKFSELMKFIINSLKIYEV